MSPGCKDLSLQGEGRGVGGICLGVGVKVTSHLGDDQSKKIFCYGNAMGKTYNKVKCCSGQCHCCSDTSECYDLSQS
jgi:hypothetical protein